ncbi:MAG: hypothetical protein M3Y39_15975 [Chloroflexota bacterium]|nr:hypothetical protein [Chloroflexota bacterium]
MMIRLFASLCVTVLLAFFLFPLKASAQASSSLSRPTFTVNIGFSSRYRDGNWMPVRVSLHNDGPDFNGSISISVPSPSISSGKSSANLTYQQAVSLPTQSQKQVTLYVPISVGNQGSTLPISVDLLDANNQKIGNAVNMLRSIGPNDIFVGILSDQTTGFGPLSMVPLADQTASIVTEQLDASELPTMTEVLKNFDLIVLDDFTTSNLTKDQLTALQNWVNQGGSLLVMGGPDGRRTLSPLPAGLLPVSLNGTTTLPAGTPLLLPAGPTKDTSARHAASRGVQGTVTISTATPVAGSTVALAAPDGTPLLAQATLGQGLICYLAFDPTLNPVLNWSNIGTLWNGLLLRTLGDKILASGTGISVSNAWRTSPNGDSGFASVLQSSLPSMVPPTWLILLLLLGYVTVLGPLRFLLVRVFKKRDWSWRIALSIIVLFSALSYTLALQQKGTSIVSSSVAVMQLGRPGTTGTSAHITTYVGVYVPNQGNFQVNLAGANLVQTLDSQAAKGNPATIVSTPDETDVKLQGAAIWTLRTLVAKHDSQVKGGIISHLVLQDDSVLRGTITNTLPYALNNIYVLIEDHFKSLGNMAAGETKAVSLSLESAVNMEPSSLADQIAESNKLPVPYTMYYAGTRMTTLQRHMAQLATLSGENSYMYCGGTSCFQSAQPIATSSGVIVNNTATLASGNGPLTQAGGRDPLLVPGASATFIAWASPLVDATNAIAVKGSRIANAQEAFIQAPLDVSFTDPSTQTVNIPSDAIQSQVVDVQGQNAQMQSPGVYTMNTGSMTFELALPGNLTLQSSSITFTEPANLIQGNGIPIGQGISSVVDVNHMQIYLYNWQKSSWDRFTFNQFVLTINNAQPYIDASGRVLAQFSNPNAALGTAVFGKPLLQVKGLLAN